MLKSTLRAFFAAQVIVLTFLTPALAGGHLASERGPVWHIVLFKLNENVSSETRAEVAERFQALEGSERDGEPYILDIVHGTQNSVEGVDRGYELGFIVKFANEADRDFYVGRPFVDQGAEYDEAHDEFKSFVGPLLAGENGVLVFDFTEQQSAKE